MCIRDRPMKSASVVDRPSSFESAGIPSPSFKSKWRIGVLLVGISLRILCYKYLNILPKANFLVQIFVATLVGLIMWQVQETITVDRWFELLFLSGLGGLLFLSILSMIGSFNQKDFNFFWNTLNPKSMRQYVGEELKR